MADIAYRTADVDGLTVFYREAGAPDAPALLLVHGFPSSSHMFRALIPMIADKFHVVAPDLPGFGKSEMPAPDGWDYTFDHLSHVIDRLTEVLGLDRPGPPRRRRGPARPAARLRQQRGALPGVPRVLPRQRAAAAGGVGPPRPVLPARRGRGVQARPPRRRRSLPADRPLRPGDSRHRDRERDHRLPLRRRTAPGPGTPARSAVRAASGRRRSAGPGRRAAPRRSR